MTDVKYVPAGHAEQLTFKNGVQEKNGVFHGDGHGDDEADADAAMTGRPPQTPMRRCALYSCCAGFFFILLGVAV